MAFKPKFISFDCYGTLIDSQMGPAAQKLFEDRVPAGRMPAFLDRFRAYGADIALEKLGRHVIVFSEVTISRHRRRDLRKFEEVVAGRREIVDWYNVSGGYDYLLKIVTPSVACFQGLMERLLAEDIGIVKFTSRIVLRHSSGTRQYPINLIASGKSRAAP